MPVISQMLPSRFLKQDDVPQPVLVTISDITQEVMDKDSGETKWAMHFSEYEKPLALNSTNIQIAAMACGSENTDDWINKKIVLYTDPNVSFAGKIVGGLRLRAPKNQPKAAPKPAPAPVGGMAEMEDDELPPF